MGAGERQEPRESCFSVGYSPVQLVDVSLEPGWFAKLDVSGAHRSGAGLKSSGARCGVPTFHSSGRISGL